jgi:EAL domain-containing protein (putative c-di-GMP-specific phosphodiesterase class I)
MYQAKAEGRGRYCIFSGALNERIATLEAQQWEYQRIIDSDELTCVFQPIRSAAGPIAMEALTRVASPLSAHHSIGDLIETAKRGSRPHEFLDRLTRQAMQTYGGYIAAHTPTNPSLGNVSLNLNIDVLQLLQEGFLDRLLAWCKEAQLAPGQVCLEIKETALETNAQELKPVLPELRAAGFRLSMDNFGSGYSSIKQFLLYEFDQIKIDRFFIDQAQGSARTRGLLAAMVAMGRSASIDVLAESIENADEEALCVQAGVELLQGFHLGRPVPIAEAFGGSQGGGAARGMAPALMAGTMA